MITVVFIHESENINVSVFINFSSFNGNLWFLVRLYTSWLSHNMTLAINYQCLIYQIIRDDIKSTLHQSETSVRLVTFP